MGNNSSNPKVQKILSEEPGSSGAARNQTNSTSNEGQVEGQTNSSSHKAVPKKIGEASEYQLVFHADPQNGQYTYDEEVEKFYSQIVVEAPKFEQVSRPSLDIVACLDVSGSMSGQKISLVRKSMRRLLRNMNAQDRVALVTFDSTVRTVMQFCNLDETNKQRALDIVGNLRPGTSTDLCGGVCQGVEQLLNSRMNDVASILLFTDGQANVGFRDTTSIVNEVLRVAGTNEPTDVESWSVERVSQWLQKIDLPMYQLTFEEQKIDGSILKFDITKEMLTETLNVSALHASKFMREVEKLRGIEGEGDGTGSEKQKGFRLHTFGFGSHHNADLLQQLAENFDGMYYFMEDEESIKSGFANCLGGLMTTVALDIEVAIQFNPECKNGKIWKENAKESKGIHKVVFGDLQSEEKRNILVSCSMPAKEAPDHDFMLYEVTFKYQNAIANSNCQEVISCVVNRNGTVDEFNEEVDETRNRDIATEALRQANILGDRNDLKSARQRLQVTIDEINNSRSAQTMTCQNLQQDLRTALSKTDNLSVWRNEGTQYCHQNVMCYQQQRACNFRSADFAYQDQCNTNARYEMDEMFSRADSCDSDDGGYYDFN